MTVREFLNNNEISLDDEIVIEVDTGDYDGEGYVCTQEFPITQIFKTHNKVALWSDKLNAYIYDFII